ncbi:MAG: RNA polymerase sigma factor [Bacteroidota bacterium]
MEEHKLIAACKANDRLAQQLLYDRYANAMFTISYRITKDRDVASDVLQEAFVRVFNYIHSFRGESTLGAWIKTIVVRSALAILKKEKKGLSFDLSEMDETSTRLNFDHDTDYLEKAILSLPSGYRTVFLLIEVEGYTHQDVADLLGVSVGTSKSQLFYAKKRLREILIPQN